MTDSLVLVSLGLSFIIVVQFIALINFRYKYLTTLRIIDSNVLPNSVTTFLGLLVTSFAVFASIVIWHYRSKYNNVLSFKSSTSTIEGENLNEVVFGKYELKITLYKIINKIVATTIVSPA